MAEDRTEISGAYPMGQLARALDQAMSNPDPSARARAEVKAQRWRQVLRGMASGSLTVGGRAPVTDTPVWVTLEVVHGGFATGNLAADRPLELSELELLERSPDGSEEITPRERLNLWYLSDDGLAYLRELLASGRYRVELPEDGALPVVAWLLDRGRYEDVLDLTAELRPWMHRLRLAPLRADTPQAVGATVRLMSAHEVAANLRSREQPEQIARMKATLLTWNPLFDELARLWATTVEGALPSLEPRGDEFVVTGGWPCSRWPDDWQARRTAWLDAHRAAAAGRELAGKHHHPKGNYARLAALLARCPSDSSDLSAREVGWIRRCLANTFTREGIPGSAIHEERRSRQHANASQPSHSDIAQVLADRLERLPPERGIPATDLVVDPVRDEESVRVPGGTEVPDHLVAKTQRAVEAPIRDLIDEGIITSAEVLATVLPQVTSQVMAENIADPEPRELYRQVYGAFRRRRSLLLLDLQHQVRIDELPWVAALPRTSDDREAAAAARATLEQVTVLAFTGFPQTLLPNPLVREFSELAKRAHLRLPLVEEVAADIFMGTFTKKWPAAARIASNQLSGSLYARYYDLPEPSAWSESSQTRRNSWFRKGPKRPDTADDFAARCRDRAQEVGFDPRRSWVASNGAVIEQSQILTTHNLAVLVDALELQVRLREHAGDLAHGSFAWALAQLSLPFRNVRASLQAIKNAAYAWRQGIYFLGLVDEATQHRIQENLSQRLEELPEDLRQRVLPAVKGLSHILRGGQFGPGGLAVGGEGRRFLGWAVERHWLLPDRPLDHEGVGTSFSV